MTIYNRTEAANMLLAEIEAWCTKTGTPEGSIGHVLFLHSGFVGLLRKRLTLSEEKEIAVRAFIYCDYPNGYRGELPKTHANGTRSVQLRSAKIRLVRGPLPENALNQLSNEEIASRRVERDPCPRCGVRADVGCAHRSSQVAFA